MSMMDLLHPQGRIIQELFILLGIGTNPLNSSVWPVFSPKEPDAPDNCLVIWNKDGEEKGNDNNSGEVFLYRGISVLVRATDHNTGYQKAMSIRSTLNKSVDHAVVSLGDSLYCIDCVTTTGDVMDLNMGKTSDRLQRFTVNALADIKILS